MKTGVAFILGWVLLVVPELLRIYFIMPFPGSQHAATVSIAYFLHNYILFFRVGGLLLIVFAFFHFLRNGKWWQKILSILLICLAAVVFYLTTQVMQADKMFLIPHHKILAGLEKNIVSADNLVLGFEINGEATCYPIQIIAYHHQVQDTVGGIPVLITYCSVCRSGRAYSPIINGKFNEFRLVGMDHFNAMLEDAATKSWWRQENGEAVAGPEKGKFLMELNSQQMTLKAWMREHPQSLILQPDPDFQHEYTSLEGYDDGSIVSNLEGTSQSSWQPKSWVIGITVGNHSRAYDWQLLKEQRVLNDTLNGVPLLIVMEDDLMSFHSWNRKLNGNMLVFEINDSSKLMFDNSTHSTWNFKGESISGPLSGSKLSIVPAYQEFWHSWITFHPNTTRYNSY